MWVAVWALMGIEAAILALWAVYKRLRESRFHSTNAENKKTSDVQLDLATEKPKATKSNDSSTMTIEESEKLTFRGYKNDYFGYIGFGSVVVTTLLFFVFLGCIVGDYCKILVV